MPMFLPSKSSPSGGTSAACSVEPPSEPFDLPEGLELDVVITGEVCCFLPSVSLILAFHSVTSFITYR